MIFSALTMSIVRIVFSCVSIGVDIEMFVEQVVACIVECSASYQTLIHLGLLQ